jgi:hypothetical protein
VTAAGLLVALLLCGAPRLAAQGERPAWSNAERPIFEQLQKLRSLPDDVRAQTTRQLALQIRALPAAPNELYLAFGLCGLTTEGNFGHDTVQEVATTLVDVLRESPPVAQAGQVPAPYVELASLVRYEHVDASLDDSEFAAAMSRLEAMTNAASVPISHRQTSKASPGRLARCAEKWCW